MDCSKCIEKGCRVSQPCTDQSIEYIYQYHTDVVQAVTRAASTLVDDGRAGTLNRLEEISEYAKLREYRVLGVAYCYSMEKEAGYLREYLQKEGFKMVMVSCTVDGVLECEVNTAQKGQSVSCNPVGQAYALNRSGAEFTILMGLCLGHDVLIQKKSEYGLHNLDCQGPCNEAQTDGCTSWVPVDRGFISRRNGSQFSSHFVGQTS